MQSDFLVQENKDDQFNQTWWINLEFVNYNNEDILGWI